jgi:hypothetical protein
MGVKWCALTAASHDLACPMKYVSHSWLRGSLL